MRNRYWITTSLTLLFVIAGTIAPAVGAPGDLVATIAVPVPSPTGVGVGIALNCQNPATLFYTNTQTAFLHKMDAAGTPLGSIPLFDSVTGAAISFGAISWDESRQMLWGGTDSSGDPPSVYLIDPVTGSAVYVFTLSASWIGFIDGIALDNDETVWVSDDVSPDIEHWTTGGVYIGTITPKDAAGADLGDISGVAVGKGDRLYLGRNGNAEIVSVTKTGNYIGKFATATGRDEDLECDVVSFAPLEVLWSKDAYGDYLEVFEVEPGTCQCAGESKVYLDIKPGSCPNPLNATAMEQNDNGNGVAVKGNGVMPVAILGSASFDVNDIDVSTILLEGLSPLRHNYDDVATPVVAGDDCDCNRLGGDGYTDLALKFNKNDIVMTLGDFVDKEMRSLTLTGMLYDGTPFEASDCVRLQGRGAIDAKAGGVHQVVLNPAIPNPFNPTTVIGYELQERAFARLAVYDVTGKLVKELVSEEKGAGKHAVEWNATGVPSGIYFYRLEVGTFVETRRMVLLK